MKDWNYPSSYREWDDHVVPANTPIAAKYMIDQMREHIEKLCAENRQLLERLKSKARVNESLEELKTQLAELEIQNKSLMAQLPWAQNTDLKWHCLGGPKDVENINLFRLNENGAQCILSLGQGDLLFVGRTLKLQEKAK